VFPIGVATHYKMESCDIFNSSLFFSRPSSAPGRVKNWHYCAWLPTSRGSSFYVSIFLVSDEREGKKWQTPNSAMFDFAQCSLAVYGTPAS
jgi:hypothetical protein